MSQTTSNYYALLRIPREADAALIKKAYKKQALLNHPDKNVGSEVLAEAKFVHIHKAWEVLSDPAKKRAHDRTLQKAARSRVATISLFTSRHRAAKATRSRPASKPSTGGPNRAGSGAPHTESQPQPQEPRPQENWSYHSRTHKTTANNGKQTSDEAAWGFVDEMLRVEEVKAARNIVNAQEKWYWEV